MALITRLRECMVDFETTPGTAVTPNNPVRVFDSKIELTAENVERPNFAATGGYITSSRGPQIGQFTGRVELRGNGNSGSPDLDGGLEVLLTCCGLQKSTLTYKPSTSIATQQTCTIYLNEGGILKALSGCAGTFTLDLVPGMPAYVNFSMSGNWVAPSDVSLAAQTHNATAPPRLVSSTYSFASLTPAPYFASMVFDPGNVVIPQQDAAAATGFRRYMVGDRKPTIKFDPEMSTVAVHNWYGLWLAGTDVALSILLGSSAGNRITLAVPKLLYQNISQTSRNNIDALDLTGLCLTGAAGDDDFTITPS